MHQMKSLELKLDQSDMVESFFYNARLICFQTDLAGFQLVQKLNRRLDYNFRAAPEHQFSMKLNAQEVWGSNNYGDAFIEFNLFSNALQPCVTEMFLYENVSDSYHLIPSLRYYNFLLLVFHAEMLLYDRDMVAILEEMPEIKVLKEVALDEIEDIENLMF